MLSMQIQTPGSSSKRIAKKIHCGNPELDEEITIPSYDPSTLTIEKITEIQGALEMKKR